LRVLVTGAAGFIGSHVARALVTRGDDVLALLRAGTSRRRVVDLVDQLRIEEADLADPERVKAILDNFQPEAVIHLAWYAHPVDYLSSSENVRSLSTTNLFAERVFASGCRKFVGVGSCVEYSSSLSPRRESDPTEPRTLYGACKRAASLVVGAQGGAAQAEVAWARVFHVHGRDEDPARLIPRVAASLTRGQAVDLSPGDQVRDHLHVTDVAAGLVHLTGPGLSGTFNVCSGVEVTLKEVLTAVGEILGRPELLRFGARPYTVAEEHYLVGDPTRLRQTGWAPAWPDLRSGLVDASSTYQGSVRP
jgi:nucleoside-diphosphate-sugar epimerase